MYKILKSTKDTYITNKVVSGVESVSSSAGYASTLDLFKLYGVTSTASGSVQIPSTEISRLLVGFDVQEMRDLYSSGKLDVNDPSFKCTLKLFDVYGGQPTPSSFWVDVFPLSRSFEEGKGKDIVYFTDLDVANYLSSSKVGGAWHVTGANKPDDTAVGNCDYFSSIQGTPITSRQYFEVGDEDLTVDVTQVLSATLVGLIPAAEFRLSLGQGAEEDQETYFVKRFGSRHIHDVSKRPQLVYKQSDALLDTAASMQLGVSGTLFVYNTTAAGPMNLIFDGNEVTGSNCLLLDLSTSQVSGGYVASFTGSQFMIGSRPQPGIYYADVMVEDVPLLSQVVTTSGSIKLTPTWKSLDSSKTFTSGPVIKFDGTPTLTTYPTKKRYVVTTYGVPNSMKPEEKTVVRVNVFDSSNLLLTYVKIPVQTTNKVPRRAYYSIRNADENLVIIPFDKEHDSTRLSTDANGCYFELDASSLASGRSYTVDVLIVEGTDEMTYRDVSTPFRVT